MYRLLLATTAFLFTANAYADYPTIVPCPTSFHGINIPDNARQCQQFDDTNILGNTESPPFSLVFFLPQPPQQTVTQFRALLPELSDTTEILTRFAMRTSDGKIKVVVSPDNAGSQVDILIAP